MSRLFSLLVVLALCTGCTGLLTPEPPSAAPTATVTSVIPAAVLVTVAPRITVRPTVIAPQATPTPLPPPVASEYETCRPLVSAPMPPPPKLPVTVKSLPVSATNGQPANVEVDYVEGQALILAQPDGFRLVADAFRGVLNPENSALLGVVGKTNFETRLVWFDRAAVDTVKFVQDVRELSAQKGVLVLADLNLLSAATPPTSSCVVGANPLSGEDSPLSGEDSPLSGEDSPFGATGIVGSAAYWQQWALNEVKPGGIHVRENGQSYPIAVTGLNTQIVILDTSPFPQPGQYVFQGKGWMDPPLSVCVEHPALLSDDLTDPCGEARDQSDHGIFVAGLAHAAARESQLRLIRVLNGFGRGDLATTIFVLANLDRGRLSKTVVNMSLGFVPVPAPGGATWQDVCQSLKMGPRPPSGNCQDIADLLDPGQKWTSDEIARFQNVLEAGILEFHVADLVNSGVVLVAAAGNKGTATNIPAAELPARYAGDYDRVVAAAASTYERRRAFYSHEGTIAAPGGGDRGYQCGSAACGAAGAAPCCWQDPKYWVISVGTSKDEKTGQTIWRYGAWAGTSFATPLISGMVAGALQAVGSSGVDVAVSRLYQQVCVPPWGAVAGLGHGIAGYCR